MLLKCFNMLNLLEYFFYQLRLCKQVVAAGANPVLITRGIEKTAKALVAELKNMSKEVYIYSSMGL